MNLIQTMTLSVLTLGLGSSVGMASECSVAKYDMQIYNERRRPVTLEEVKNPYQKNFIEQITTNFLRKVTTGDSKPELVGAREQSNVHLIFIIEPMKYFQIGLTGYRPWSGQSPKSEMYSLDSEIEKRLYSPWLQILQLGKNRAGCKEYYARFFWSPTQLLYDQSSLIQERVMPRNKFEPIDGRYINNRIEERSRRMKGQQLTEAEENWQKEMPAPEKYLLDNIPYEEYKIINTTALVRMYENANLFEDELFSSASEKYVGLINSLMNDFFKSDIKNINIENILQIQNANGMKINMQDLRNNWLARHKKDLNSESTPRK